MKTILLSVLLLMAVILPAGCKTQSPARTAINIDKTIITSVGVARDAWAQWYVSRRAVLTGNPANADALAKLEGQRAQVNAAWFHYANAATVAILAQEAAFSTNGVPDRLEAVLTAAGQPFIDLVKSFIK